MNAKRFQTPYYHRSTLYLGASAAFWSGSLAAGAVIAGLLYYLLTRDVSV